MERLIAIEAVQNALRKPALPLSVLAMPELPAHELLASLTPKTNRAIHIPPRNISVTFSTEKWIPCIISGVATTESGATIAFYQHKDNLTNCFRIYDHLSQAAQQNKYDTEHAHFLKNAQRVTILTLRNSPLDRFYFPVASPLHPPPPTPKCTVCQADGFTAQTSCITPICYSCRTRGVFCACMEPPKGLVQVSDAISGQSTSTHVTICTGLKVGKCPNAPNKLPAFLSNTPYMHMFDPKSQIDDG